MSAAGIGTTTSPRAPALRSAAHLESPSHASASLPPTITRGQSVRYTAWGLVACAQAVCESVSWARLERPDAQARWEARKARRAARRQGNASAGVILGIVLVSAGSWILIERYLPALDMSWLLPGVLIVVGIALVLGALGRSRRPDAG